MPEVLHVDIDDAQRTTLHGPDAVLDPATAAVVDAAVAHARDDAFREGERAGRDAARSELGRVAQAIDATVSGLRADLDAQRDEATRASLELARVVAAAVLDATPPAEALAVLDRVREATAVLDDAPLTVRLHADDHRVLADLLDDDRLDLVADATVGRGDARIEGASGGADLTRQALLDAALDAFGQEAR